MTDPWADGGGDPREAATLRRVRAAARVALLLAVVGAATGLPDPPEKLTTRTGIALAMLGTAFGLAVWCLWHGARNAHERGRATAAVALAVSIVAAPLALAATVPMLPFGRVF